MDQWELFHEILSPKYEIEDSGKFIKERNWIRCSQIISGIILRKYGLVNEESRLMRDLIRLSDPAQKRKGIYMSLIDQDFISVLYHQDFRELRTGMIFDNAVIWNTGGYSDLITRSKRKTITDSLFIFLFTCIELTDPSNSDMQMSEPSLGFFLSFFDPVKGYLNRNLMSEKREAVFDILHKAARDFVCESAAVIENSEYEAGEGENRKLMDFHQISLYYKLEEIQDEDFGLKIYEMYRTHAVKKDEVFLKIKTRTDLLETEILKLISSYDKTAVGHEELKSYIAVKLFELESVWSGLPAFQYTES